MFPRIVAEAYALGIPVVASRLGSLAEIVHDGETGILFEPEDVDGLAQALRRLAGDPAEARRLGEHARREYERNLTPRATVERLLKIYAPARAGRTAGIRSRRERPSERRPRPPSRCPPRRGGDDPARRHRPFRRLVLRGVHPLHGHLLPFADHRPGVRFAIRNGTITNYGPSWWDQQKFGQFTPGDLAVIGFAYIGAIARLSSRRTQLHTRTAWLIGIGIVAVTIGVAVGVLNSTPSPFGDWRYLAIGLLFAFGLWSTILQTERDCFRFAQIFVAIMAVYGVDQLMNYAKGGGEIAFYGRTTSGDHATLEFMVAAVGISMAMLRTRRTRALWWPGS